MIRSRRIKHHPEPPRGFEPRSTHYKCAALPIELWRHVRAFTAGAFSIVTEAPAINPRSDCLGHSRPRPSWGGGIRTHYSTYDCFTDSLSSPTLTHPMVTRSASHRSSRRFPGRLDAESSFPQCVPTLSNSVTPSRVQMEGFEPSTSRSQTERSDQTELHPLGGVPKPLRAPRVRATAPPSDFPTVRKVGFEPTNPRF